MKRMTPAQQVDALGKLRAKLAQLEEEEKYLCTLLKDTGASHVVGKLYEATIFTNTKTTVDMEVIRTTLNPQFLADHTKRTVYTVVKVTSLKPKV
jgi:hypothetical protein